MQGQMETNLGKIVIESDVIATYAGSVAVECFGIVGMAAVNMKDGLVKLLKKDYLNHGIAVSIDENNEITLDGDCQVQSRIIYRYDSQGNEYLR